MGKLFGTDGIRGVVGENLTADLAFRTGKAIAAVLKEEKVGISDNMIISGKPVTSLSGYNCVFLILIQDLNPSENSISLIDTICTFQNSNLSYHIFTLILCVDCHISLFEITHINIIDTSRRLLFFCTFQLIFSVNSRLDKLLCRISIFVRALDHNS